MELIKSTMKETLRLDFGNVRSTAEFRDFVREERFIRSKLAKSPFLTGRVSFHWLLSIFLIS